MEQWLVWLITVVILILIELCTINLVTIWFVASGIIALIVSLFTNNYVLQFGTFVILGVVLLITTKPILMRYVKNNHSKTNLDRIIGMTGKVTEKISKYSNGEVKVDGKKWTAYSDKTIKEGSMVKVLEIKGVRIKVEELDK